MDMETTTAVAEAEHQHRYLYEIFIDFWVELYEFFKYIFYDVYRGVEPI